MPAILQEILGATTIFCILHKLSMCKRTSQSQTVIEMITLQLLIQNPVTGHCLILQNGTANMKLQANHL